MARSFVLLLVLLVACAAACGGPPPAAEPAGGAAREPARDSRGEPAREGLSSGFVFVGCGFLFVDGEGSAQYSVLLPGKDVKQVPGEAAFILDGTLVEVTTTDAAAIGIPNARGAELLRAHAKWETEHVRVAKGWERLEIAEGGGEVTPAPPGTSMLMWGLDLPTEIDVKGVRVNRIAFVTAAIESVVLVLAVPLAVGGDPREPAQKLGSIMRTVRRSLDRIDLGTLAAEISSSAKP